MRKDCGQRARFRECSRYDAAPWKRAEPGLYEYQIAATMEGVYLDAAGHDGPGKVIFFEGARITLEAHIAEYPPECHAELRKVAAVGDNWNPDKVIVLTSSTDTIEKHIRLRNRLNQRSRGAREPGPHQGANHDLAGAMARCAAYSHHG